MAERDQTIDATAVSRRSELLTRRKLIGLTAGALVAADALSAQRVAAQDEGAVASLVALSQILCGGGTFDADRAAKLLTLIQADATMSQGLDELLQIDGLATMAQESGKLPGSADAQTTAGAILSFWYASVWDGKPTEDRGSAYYGVTAWQAMYTPVVAVCKGYGTWEKAPSESPLVPANAGKAA